MNGYQITFFTQQDRRHRGKPMADWLVVLAGELGLRGATVIPASGSCVYAVAMAPSIGGPRSGNFAVNSNTTETPNLVGLSGTGVNPVVAAAGVPTSV